MPTNIAIPAAVPQPATISDPRADCRGKKIGILIVAYNAVTTVVKVLRRIQSEAWDNVAEVVVFDDASQDFTYELALGYKATAQADKLNVLRHQENLGYGGNQKAGYQYFLEKGFDIVVLLHGDGQYAPEILSHLYHPLVTGEADAVFGSRMMKEYGGPLKGGMPLYKYAGNRILTALENRAFHMNLTEFHSGYRAYNLHALRDIDFSKMTDDFHFDTEIIIKLQHQGFRIKEVPIPTYYGDEICYVNGLKYARDVARAVVRYRRTVESIERCPEFEEYWVHYPIKASKYSSHYYLWQFVGSGNRVLDIGCGEGFLASKLSEIGNEVTGIDILAAPKHASTMQSYLQCDLFAGIDAIASQLDGRKYDKILLLDVLEHLPAPEKILRSCLELLTPQGQALVSVPNVANFYVRLMLLFGRFPYAARGILDRTHLRFYTRKTARQLVEENGFEVIRQTMTVVPVELALGMSARNPVARALTAVLGVLTKFFPGLLGYQSVLQVRRRVKSDQPN